VAGAFRIGGGIHAFRWTETGGIEDLGGPTGQWGVWGEATGINDEGLVVGWSKLSDVDFRALLWDADGRMSDLNDMLDDSSAGWTLASAQGINNLGQIVGYGLLDGQTRAFLLTPVPEPSSLLALVCGLAGLGGAVRRRRS
jgi:probable HAF family extracellular repeat protein